MSWWTRNNSAEKEEKPVEIYALGSINSIAMFADGEHFASAGDEGKIRRWRIEDGKEEDTPMDVGRVICNISVSRDGRWVVGGLAPGLVTVWDTESDEQIIEFKAHTNRVSAVDVSPDSTRIVTGSLDNTACLWSLLTGERLIGPLRHDFTVVAAMFSPDGGLIATATFVRKSIRVYNAQNGHPLFEFPIEVGSPLNGSLAWDTDGKRLFALSREGHINCLDVSNGTTLCKWRIHKTVNGECITLASNGRFIAASGELSVSFWDTMTHKQIGPVIELDHAVHSMAISPSHNLVMGGGVTINLRSLTDILPSSYFDDTSCVMVGEEGQDEIPKETRPRTLEEIVQELRDELANSKRVADGERDGLNETINSLRADLRMQAANSNEKIVHLERTVQELRDQLLDSERLVNQREENHEEIVGSLRVDLRERDERSSSKIADLEKIVQQLHSQLAESQRKAGNLAQIIRVKCQCEALYAEGRIIDAAVSLLEILDAPNEEVRADDVIMDWIARFTTSCITMLERIGDEAFNAGKQDEAAAAYATALSLSSSTPDIILTKWAGAMLVHGSSHEVLGATAKFKLPRFLIYRTICDILEKEECFTEAISCFRQMQNDLPKDANAHNERTQWELAFQRRCVERLEQLGNAAMSSKKYDEAIGCYSQALVLDPTNSGDILFKRSKGLAATSAWEEALIDADRVIELDSSSYKGYEVKHAALHGMERYSEAFGAFETMLSKLEQSPDPRTFEFCRRFIDPTPSIRKVIEQTIKHMPRVLIDTATGRLCDKTQQATAFEELPIYDELRSSMITRLDHARIRKVVKTFYQYVMLSHRWQPNEPTFQMVEGISVYGLSASPANTKLQNFCNLVRSLHFNWAWSDTCCVNQFDKGVQQESLVAMFRWYRGSSLTIVHLLGVLSESQQSGGLWKSVWNTRGWTYQEYVASQVIQFYTEDWKPYLDLAIFNHKESEVVLSEMERAMNYATSELAALCPGLDRVREKLYLASTRHTTREEDIAYSLFGIFNVAIPVIYGEGNQAVGRLLEHVLTGSGDVAILAWTGRASHYNSCLPIDLAVYDQLVPPHIPQPIEATEMDVMVAALRASLGDSLPMELYRRLHDLPTPSIAASRLRLPGIVFPITQFNHGCEFWEQDTQTRRNVYHGTTDVLGEVTVQTTDDLSQYGTTDLVLVHPWISPLLDQEFSHDAAPVVGWTRSDDAAVTRALRLVVRLSQPFGALLLAPVSRTRYRRVAADGFIVARVQEALLGELVDGIRILDVQ